MSPLKGFMKKFCGLSKDDEDLAALFENAGLGHHEAHVLMYVRAKGETTSKDIQKVTKLRQPEVSLAIKDLRANKWIDNKLLKKDKGKGRPTHIYSLSTSFDDIVEHFIEENRNKIESIEKDIEDLENLK